MTTQIGFALSCSLSLGCMVLFMAQAGNTDFIDDASRQVLSLLDNREDIMKMVNEV